MHPTTTSSIAVLALLPPLAMFAVGLLASLGGPTANRRAVRAARLASWFTLPVAASLIGAVAAEGSLSTPLLGAAGLGFALRIDALSIGIYAMVAILALVLIRFSSTYLEGDPRQGVFLGRMCTTIAAVLLLVTAGNLAHFFVAWVATSLSLHGLLIFYRERPRARIAAEKKFLVARIGDAALLAAFALLYRAFGTGDLTAILDMALPAASGSTGAGLGGSLQVATLLIAVAALFKSAQFPTHGWLVEVMETPTPVSALLHAGILNAGPFLVLRFAAVMDLATASSLLLVAVGGFTALFASAVLLTQPSIKVALGYSSAAHMGFTLFVCGLGVYAAAVLHLVAHSFYKAHAFLSSGSVVDVARSRGVPTPPRLRSRLRIGASLISAVAVYLGVAWVLGVDPAARPELLAVGAVVVLGLSQLLAHAFDSAGTTAAMARAGGLAALVAFAFFSLESGIHHLLEGALPPADEPNLAVIALTMVVLTAFAGAVAVQIALPKVDPARARALQVHLRNGFYANAFFDRLIGALRRA